LRRRIGTTLLALAAAGSLAAQDSAAGLSPHSWPTVQYEIVEAGPAWRRVADAATAVSIYDGPGLFFGNGNVKREAHRIQAYRSWFGYHRIDPPSGPTTQELFMTFTYGHAWRFRRLERTYLAAGPLAELLGPMRFTPGLNNSFLSWEVVGGLGPWLHAERQARSPFSDRRWTWYAEGSTLLGAYVNRPLYGLVLDRDQPQDERWSWIGELVRLQAEVGFTVLRTKPPCPDKPFDRWKLAYRWELLHWAPDDGQAVTAALHQLQLGLMIGQDREADRRARERRRAERRAAR
jgi:hypothetical protein